MLEVIVLGKVPGTKLQITFSQVAAVALVALLIFIAVREKRLQKRNPDTPSIKDVLRQVSTNPLVVHFAHRVLALRANISVRRLG